LLLLTFPEQGQLFAVAIGGFHVFSFRIVLLASFALLAFNRDLRLSGRYGRWFVILMGIWIAYAFISLAWVRSVSPAFYDMAYLGIALLTFVTISSLYMNLKESYMPFVKGWLAVFVLLLVIATMEIMTGWHLEGRWFEHSQTIFTDHPNRFMPAATFGNPNDYASFLVMTIPIGLLAFSKRYVPAGWLIVCAVIVMAYFSSSRLALIAVCVQMLLIIAVGLWKAQGRSRHHVAGAVVALALSLAAIALIMAPASRETHPAGGDSRSIRLDLVRNGWHLFKESKGLGVGAGNFAAALEETETPYPKGDVRSPHNWYVEVLSQYGIAIFVLFGALMFAMGLPILRGLRGSGQPIWPSLFCALMLTSYLIICCLSSGFMKMLYNWIPLTALILGVDRLYREVRHR
jgi:hypothetical protein